MLEIFVWGKMSFDLKLVNGDIQIDKGAMQIVTNVEKLIQDVLKMLFTPTGDLNAHPWYGTNILNKAVVGTSDPDLIVIEIQTSVEAGIKNLITLQEMQAKDNQFVTPKELIGRIKDIGVHQNEIDNRHLSITVELVAKSNDLVQESFIVSS